MCVYVCESPRSRIDIRVCVSVAAENPSQLIWVLDLLQDVAEAFEYGVQSSENIMTAAEKGQQLKTRLEDNYARRVGRKVRN